MARCGPPQDRMFGDFFGVLAFLSLVFSTFLWMGGGSSLAGQGWRLGMPRSGRPIRVWATLTKSSMR